MLPEMTVPRLENGSGLGDLSFEFILLKYFSRALHLKRLEIHFF